MEDKNATPRSDYERNNDRLRKYLFIVLGIWFICNAVLVSVVILVTPEKLHNRRIITPAITAQAPRENSPARPIISNGPHNVIFNDYTLLQKTPDGEPYPDRDFIPAGKATDVIILERTAGEIGGVKWYKVQFTGKKKPFREGWVPEYGIIDTGQRRQEINKIREHEMRLRGYTIGLDLRGKWINKTNGTILLANIDLSYLTIIHSSQILSLKLEKLIRKRKNVFRLTAERGIWMDIAFKNNRFHSVIRSHLKTVISVSIKRENILGNYYKKPLITP